MTFRQRACSAERLNCKTQLSVVGQGWCAVYFLARILDPFILQRSCLDRGITAIIVIIISGSFIIQYVSLGSGLAFLCVCVSALSRRFVRFAALVYLFRVPGQQRLNA